MGKSSVTVVLLSGVLLEQDGKYMLVQEAKDKAYSKCKDLWTLPHGSYDGEGETIKGLGERELLEETGGKASFNGKLVTVEGWGLLANQVRLVCIVWSASDWEQVQERWTDEIKDVQYFSKAELQQMLIDGKIRDNFPVIEVINAFTEGKNGLIRWNIDR